MNGDDQEQAAASSPLASDPRSVPELLLVALAADEDAAWGAIGALHYRGSREVLGYAVALCGSAEPAERARGADVLGQLGIPARTFPEECFAALLLLLTDNDDRVIFPLSSRSSTSTATARWNTFSRSATATTAASATPSPVRSAL